MQQCPVCANDRLFSVVGRRVSRGGLFVFVVVTFGVLIEGGAVASGLASPRVLTWPAVFIGAAIRFLVLRETWPIVFHARHADMPAWKEWTAGLVLVVVPAFAGTGTQDLLNLLGMR